MDVQTQTMKNAISGIALCAVLAIVGCAHSRVTSHELPTESTALSDPAESSIATQDDESGDSPDESVALNEQSATEQSVWKTTTSDDSQQSVILTVDHTEASYDESPASTLAALEQLALSNNPTLAELQSKIDATNGRWLQVGLKPNPTAGITSQEIGNDGSAGQHGVFVEQEFVTANKLDLNRSAAAWRVDKAEQQLTAQRLRVLTDVRRGFYAVLVAQERTDVAEELHTIAMNTVAKATELIKMQEARSVLTQAEIEAELAELQVDNSRIQQVTQWRKLAAVIGQPHLPSRKLDGELTVDAPQIVWEQTLDRLRRESPEIAAAVAALEESRWALQRANVQATPNITLNAAFAYDDSSSDPFASLQLSMPIPVYNRNQGGIAEAQANVITAERAIERVKLGLQRRLASVYQQYEQSRNQAARYEGLILRKSRENLALNRESYESGQSSYLAVLTAQRSYAQAQLAWLNAVAQLWDSTVQIEGLLLSDSLQ